MKKNDSNSQIEQKTRVGIALSSGRARGVYTYFGFVRALEKMNLDISVVARCTAGTVVGGILASEKNMSSWASTQGKKLLKFYGYLKPTALEKSLNKILTSWKQGELPEEELGNESTCCPIPLHSNKPYTPETP